ncbi:MAG: cell division protein SepF [Solobacterium sp.]|nr:cell division protein SepF [Solobacterium sp.]
MDFKKIFQTEEEIIYDEPKKVNRNNGLWIRLYEPKEFDSSNAMAEDLKNNISILVNLHNMPKDYSQRTIDFLTGVCYSLDGRIEKVSHGLIVCVPHEGDLYNLTTGE